MDAFGLQKPMVVISQLAWSLLVCDCYATDDWVSYTMGTRLNDFHKFCLSNPQAFEAGFAKLMYAEGDGTVLQVEGVPRKPWEFALLHGRPSASEHILLIARFLEEELPSGKLEDMRSRLIEIVFGKDTPEATQRIEAYMAKSEEANYDADEDLADLLEI